MNLFRRFKGMIRPGMALTFDDSRKVADRKSVPMVEYLRARRHAADLSLPAWVREDCHSAKRRYRQAHLRLRARALEARDD